MESSELVNKYLKKVQSNHYMQSGGEVDMYGSPINAPIQRKDTSRSFYDSRRGVINVGTDFDGMSPEEQDELIAHENRHDWQYKNDRSNFEITHNPEYAFNERLQKKPNIVNTDEIFNQYHDRQQKETDLEIVNFKKRYPQFSFVPDQMLYDKGFVDNLYDNPNSLEGEAQYYQKTGERSFQKGGTLGSKSWDEQLERVRKEKASKPFPKLTVADLIAEKKLRDQNIGRQLPPQMVRDNIQENKPKIGKILTPAEIGLNRLYRMKQEQGEIRSYTPQSLLSKAKEVALNPLTAFGYSVNNQRLPDNFSKGERNILDNVIDLVNPAFYANQGKEAIDNTSSAINNVSNGQYPAAYRDIKNAGINALNFIPAVEEIRAGSRALGKFGIAPELRQNLRTQGIGNQLPPPPSELYIPIEGGANNTINLRRGAWNGIIEGRKRKRPTMLDDLLDAKFIPGAKKRILPENLKPIISNLEDRAQIRLVGEDNVTRASLTLKEKRNWNVGEDGKIVMDDLGNPTQKPKEWMSPEMISVNPELQGNRTQDLLYQMGIEEAKKRNLRGIYSGETLLSPDKTKKAYERFDKEIFKERSATPSYNREGTELVNYNEVGLLGHKNTQLQQEWLENYNKLNKFQREKLSIKDVSDMANISKEALLGVGAVGLVGWGSTQAYNQSEKLNEQQKQIDSLKQNNKKLPIKQQGGTQYTDNELAFIKELKSRSF
jgi:hypothetical protein